MDQKSIRIGTSGWSYKEWERIFYPNSKTPKLTFYSSVFDTTEIDSTFYSNPSKGLVMGWVKNTTKNFEFSMKLPQSITHKKQLDLSAGAEIDLVEFLDLVEPVREAQKLGPLLIQLPPSFGINKLDLLEEFLGALAQRKKDYYRFAIEFRNKSWLKEKDSLNALLRKYNVARTIVDEPLLPVDVTPTADFSFIRWHGRGNRPWYNYEYTDEEIDPWVETVNEQAKKTKKVYGYYNNHFHGYAVENSLTLLQKLKIASVDQEAALSKVRKNIHDNSSYAELNSESPEVSLDKGTRKRGKEESLIHQNGQTSLGDF